jgi:hypothetical protein
MFGFAIESNAVFQDKERQFILASVFPTCATLSRNGKELPLYGIREERIATPDEIHEFRRIGKPVYLAD